MFNMMLDRMPTDFEGYLIRTSFRIGIQIAQCLDDNNLSDEDRIAVAFNLLYGNGVPSDFERALRGLRWFMGCGNINESDGKPSDNKEVIFWDFDASRIYSSFMSTYNIDLTTADMHWFKFVSMMGSLRRDCAMSSAITIRTYDLKDLHNAKSKTEMMKLKKELTPPQEFTDEEKEALEKFNSLFSGDINGK